MAETFFKKNRLAVISLLLSISILISIILINADIAGRYKNADGKTKVSFELVEYLNYSYKYYLLVPATIALIAGFISFYKKEDRTTSTLAAVISLFVIILTLLPAWKLFINP